MDMLDAAVIGKRYLLQTAVDSCGLVIFTYWFSTIPIDLWKAGDAYQEDTIRERITGRPDIEKTRLNFQGLIFKFNVEGKHDGPYYALKTPCCKRDGDYWTVDFSKIFYWMRFMLFGQ